MHRDWTFLTHHAHVLLAVARDPDARVQDLAAVVRISERAALSILQDLEDAGYLQRTRTGRRNHYTVQPHRPFRHPAAADHEVDDLIAVFGAAPAAAGAGGAVAEAEGAALSVTSRSSPALP